MLKLKFFVATLLVGVTLHAQTPKDSSATKIKVFAPSNTKQSKKKQSTGAGYLWAVKFDMLSTFISGDIPISYEYRIAPKLSLEGSLGLTYGGDLLTIMSDGEIASSYDTKGLLGLSQRGALKFYPSSYDDAIEGWYMGLSLYNKTFNRAYEDPLPSFTKNYKSNTFGGQFIFGKQVFVDDNITVDWGVGVGIGSKSTYDYDPNNDYSAYTYTKTSRLAPSFSYVIKVGFGK